MATMVRTGLKRVILKKENFELTLEREEQTSGKLPEHFPGGIDDTGQYSQAWLRADQALSRGSEPLSGRFLSPAPSETKKEDAESAFILSPMVGTFYCSTSPEASPLVKPGDKVDKNDVVCIIEAMKVMNEIKANVTGTVAEVLVDTGQPVEFGTKLFRIVE